MPSPSAPPLKLLALAAELRAAGASWETVAAQVQRQPRTVREWPLRYPLDWKRLYRDAEDRLATEVGAEALFLLRKFARSKDDKLAQNTAKFLYTKQCEKQAAQEKHAALAASPYERWIPFIAYLETLTHDQVKAFLDAFLAQRSAAAGAAMPAGGSPPGPPVAG